MARVVDLKLVTLMSVVETKIMKCMAQEKRILGICRLMPLGYGVLFISNILVAVYFTPQSCSIVAASSFIFSRKKSFSPLTTSMSSLISSVHL